MSARDIKRNYKRGYNWSYKFMSSDDGSRVVVTSRVLFESKQSRDVIVSGYPGGRQEDGTALAIHEVTDLFLREAAACGISVRPFGVDGELVVDASISDQSVQAFAAALAKINRVFVEINGVEVHHD